jgi:hypothetical protein
MPWWFSAMLYGLLSSAFLYQIHQRLHHGAPESFVGLNDRRLWTLKITAILVMAVIVAIILFHR